MSLRLGLKHSCPWPRKGLSSEGVSLALDFLCTWPRALGPRLPEVEVESRTLGSRIGQGHKKIQGHGQGQPFRGKTVRPMTGMLEANDWNARDHSQGPRTQAQVFSKKRSSKFFSGDLQKFNYSKNRAVLEPRT